MMEERQTDFASRPGPSDPDSVENKAPSEPAETIVGEQNAAPWFKRPWVIWISMNVVIGGTFLYALLAPAATSIKTAWLPGETTSGHYQIELKCNACHESESDSSKHSSDNVMQDACIRCHGEELKRVNDTHPARKFNDPTNADRLSILDAQNCLTCHQEHVAERTLPMGLTIPVDYCWHCHQDVGDSRPSHVGMTHDSCATAGCHNYHDNRALFEKHLDSHFGEPDHFESARVPSRNFGETYREKNTPPPLVSSQADMPKGTEATAKLIAQWAETNHAAAGINCSGCHLIEPEKPGPEKPESSRNRKSGLSEKVWSDAVAMDVCERCHEGEVETFLGGKHGMRFAADLPPMTPAQARLPMHQGAAHKELTCNACHDGHRFDTQYAAVTACQKCHADDHSLAYHDTSHAQLWRDEVSGRAGAGTGVSCATCHLPRLVDGKSVQVNHNQNDGLRPNESMARDVCNHCHSLEYALSALADEQSVQNCFSDPPAARIESVQMAHDWFEQKAAKRRRGKEKSNSGS